MRESRHSRTCAQSRHSGSFILGVCKESAFVPDMPRRAQCGRWNFLRDTGLAQRIIYIFLYLFIHLFVFEV